MLSFKKVFSEFVKGDASVDVLEQEIIAFLQRSPDQNNNVLVALSRLQQAGKLQVEDFSRLLLIVAESNRAPLSPDSEGLTTFKRPNDVTTMAPQVNRENSSEEPPVPDDGSTVVRGTTTGNTTSGYSSPTTGRSQYTWSNFGAGSSATLEVGSLIKDRFLLESIIGRGGMGLVYKAKDLRKEEAQDRNPWVAIKVLNDDFKQHPEALRALQREARKSQDLSHPNIITVFDFDRDGDNVYMTMELMQGDPLDKVIKRVSNEPLTVEEALRITREMGLALEYAHKAGIVHSDFKPSNVFLINKKGVKVFDFGIARASKQGAIGAQGEVTKFDAGTLGALTPAYASLEMLKGQEPDPRDDVYALACVAHELLTGKHPFDKKSADIACTEKMTVAPIPGLNRRQMRGLLKGLAFDRANRSESIEQFLSDISRRQLSKKALVGSIAAAVVVVTAGAVSVPFYIQKLKVDSIVDTIQKGDESSVLAAMDAIVQLDKETRRKVISDADAQEGVIAFVENKVNKLFNPDKNLYDYPTAKDLLNRGMGFYKDSATLRELSENIEKSKNALMLRMDTLYTQYLESGKLLDDGTSDNISAVLAIVRQVDPASSLLVDKRLAGAYLNAAKDYLAKKDLASAEALTAAGLQRFSGDAALVNIDDSIKSEKNRRDQAEKIAQLSGVVDAAIPILSSMPDIKSLEVTVKALRDLDPECSSLMNLQSAVAVLVDENIAKAELAHDWSSYEEVLSRYKGLSSAAWYAQKHDYMVQQQKARQQMQKDMMASVIAAVTARKLDGTAEDTAESIMKRMSVENVDAHVIDQAKVAVSQAYIKLAREDRRGQDWTNAKQKIQSGLVLIAGHNASEVLLKKELAEIESAEKQASIVMAEADRVRMEQARKAKIDTLQQEFETALQGSVFDLAVSMAALDKLDEISSLDASNPLVGDGSQKVAARVVEYARNMGQQGNWQEGLKLVQDVALLIPQSKLLQEANVSMAKGLKDSEELAAKQVFASNKQKLEALIAQPELSSTWEASVKDLLLEMDSDAVAQNQTVAMNEIRHKIARVYIAQIKSAREAARFAEAEKLLDKGRLYAPDFPEWEFEISQLVESQKAFEQAREDQAKLAKIDALKQTMLTQAKANEVRSARKTLDELSKLAPDDLFIKDVAPPALVEAYARLAEASAKGKQYDNAVTYVQTALEIMPANAMLQQDLQRYSSEKKKVDFIKAFKTPTKESLQVAERLLSEMSAGLVAGDVKALKQDMAPKVAAIIKGLIASDATLARQALPEAKRILGDDPAFKELQLPAESAAVTDGSSLSANGLQPDTMTGATGETKPTDSQAVNGAARPVKAPKVVVPASTTARVQVPSQSPCTSELAGYGSKGRGVCHDMLSATDKGPTMVVLPAGGGFGQSFTISKYEITFGDYKLFCSLSSKCNGSEVSSDGAGFPVVGLPVAKIQEYATWLSASTGVDYRLPTSKEWEYAAVATGKTTEKDFNCQVSVGGSLIRGNGLVESKTGKPNGWGLVNYIGNAQELVQDGGSITARGGAFTDSIADCDITASRSFSGKIDKVTGFRLVRALK